MPYGIEDEKMKKAWKDDNMLLRESKYDDYHYDDDIVDEIIEKFGDGLYSKKTQDDIWSYVYHKYDDDLADEMCEWAKEHNMAVRINKRVDALNKKKPLGKAEDYVIVRFPDYVLPGNINNKKSKNDFSLEWPNESPKEIADKVEKEKSKKGNEKAWYWGIRLIDMNKDEFESWLSKYFPQGSIL